MWKLHAGTNEDEIERPLWYETHTHFGAWRGTYKFYDMLGVGQGV
jgi:hypothetical protein